MQIPKNDIELSEFTYIALYRKLLSSAVFHNEGLLKVWIWCLLKTTHSKKRIVPITTGKGISEVEIVKGQFIFGRKKAAQELNMNPNTVYKRMKKLKKLGNLTMQSNTHYSIVSIINWDVYQTVIPAQWQAKYQASTRQVPGKYQASNTGNNVKELKQGKQSIKKKNIPTFFLKLAEHFYTIKKTQTNVRIKKESIEPWAKELFKLERLDKYSQKEIEQAVEFALTDFFWVKQVISLNSIRNKSKNGLRKFENLLSASTKEFKHVPVSKESDREMARRLAKEI